MAHSAPGSQASGSSATDSSFDSSKGSALRWPRVLRRGLGVFWIIAGILQFQPLMFTPDFYAWYPNTIMESIVQTAADDQPGFVVSIVHLGSNIWSTSPILFNVIAATLQLLIGLLLVFGRRRVQQIALVAAIIWGSMVWITAEAFGDVFGGSSYFDGFPGAALLYVISSILVLAAWNSQGGSVRRVKTALRYLVTLFWFWVAFLQVLPSSGLWQPDGLVQYFANEASQPGPRFLALPVQHFSLVVQSHAATVNLVIVLVMLLMAFLTLFNAWNVYTITLALVWLVWSWWFGQGFGAILTGAGTDVNSIPLVGLWMVCLWTARYDSMRGSLYN